MRIFLGVMARGRVTVRDLADRIESVADVTLPYAGEPHRSDLWVAPSGRLALRAWDNEAGIGEALVDVAADGRSARARGGLGHMAASGDASWVSVDDGSGCLTATTRLARLAPVYWTRTPDAWLVSNRALLLARLAAPDGVPRYHLPALGPFVTDGYLRHDRTPFPGVELLGPDGSLALRDDTARVTLPDPAELRCGSLVPTESDLDELTRGLREAAASSAAGEVVCDVTGGRDSRLVAATLHAAGIPFRARTRGAPDHPDVLVATQVARALGVPHERVSPPTVAGPTGEVLEIDTAARTRATLFATDGMLFGWENVLGNLPQAGNGPRLGGGGGAPLPAGYANLLSRDLEPSWDAATTFLRSRLEQFGRLFRPGVTDEYARTLQAWIDTDQAAGVPAGVSLDRYYVWYRTGRWKAAFLAGGSPAVTRHLLLDDRVTRFGLRLAPAVKAANGLAQELTVRLAPALRDIPYADRRHGRVRIGHGAATEATATPFDWRRTTTDQLYPTFREQVFEGPGSRQLSSIVDRDRLARWFERRAGDPPADLARIAVFMWGLYSCSLLLSNEWLEPARGAPHPVRIRVPAGSDTIDEG